MASDAPTPFETAVAVTTAWRTDQIEAAEGLLIDLLRRGDNQEIAAVVIKLVQMSLALGRAAEKFSDAGAVLVESLRRSGVDVPEPERFDLEQTLAAVALDAAADQTFPDPGPRGD